MSAQNFDPNDPRLTSFALGELDGPEFADDRTQIEQLLAVSEEARESLKEIEATMGMLRSELQAELFAADGAGLTAAQREAIEVAASGVGVGSDRAGSNHSVQPDVEPATSNDSVAPPRRSMVGIMSSVATMAVVVVAVVVAQRGNQSEMTTSDDASHSRLVAASESADSMNVAQNADFANDSFDGGAFDGSVESERGMAGPRAKRLPGEMKARSLDVENDADAVMFQSVARDAAKGKDKAFGDQEDDLAGAPVRREVAKAGKVVRTAEPTLADKSSFGGKGAGAGGGAGAFAGSSGNRSNALPKQDSAEKSQTGSRAFSKSDTKFRVAKKNTENKNAGGKPVDGKVRSLAGAPSPRNVLKPRAGQQPQGQQQARQQPQAQQNGQSQSEEKRVTYGRNDQQKLAQATKNGQPNAERPQNSVGVPGKGDVVRQAPGGVTPRGGFPVEKSPGGAIGGGKLAGGRGLPPDLANQASDKPMTPAIPGGPLVAANSRQETELQKSLKLLSESSLPDDAKKVAEQKIRERYRRRVNQPAPGNEYFAPIIENPFIEPHDQKAISTFAVDVDTASYSNVRRYLKRDQVPPADAVRVEELINYFTYNYKQPEGDEPFAIDVELANCPWNTKHQLARIGLQAKKISKEKRPRTNLVFLVDESGSMRAKNKLPLVKTALKLLVRELTEDDQIAIVTYSSTIKVRLEATSGAKQKEINAVIDSLNAGGSTNGSGGIQKAYDVANKSYLQDSSNRVILCTDGDFNVGISDDNELKTFIKEKAASGVFLSVFGFGMGNLKDAKLETLADNGNGHYGYIDDELEARKVFQEQVTGTLYTVAKDVKIQVRFNHNKVGAYRLIGYGNRLMPAQDFDDPTKDAGEIGAGHSVTALYEIVPKSVWAKRRETVLKTKYQLADEKAQADSARQSDKFKDELFTVKLRYKKPDSEKSESALDYPVKDFAKDQKPRPSDDLMFAASVASFGMNLRDSEHKGSWGLMEVQETAEGTVGEDPSGIRREFVQLVKTARRLIEPTPDLNRPANVPKLKVPPKKLSADEARNRATVDGKYRRLLKRIEVEKDLQSFGAFYDYGRWDYTSYAGFTDLPKGHWVYVYPSWYIWAEKLESKPERTEPE